MVGRCGGSRTSPSARRRAPGYYHSGWPPDLARLDGLVVAGGTDVDPTLYGQSNTSARHVDTSRDRLERDLILWAVAEGKPVLGICRGMQLLTVALGGTLHQEASAVSRLQTGNRTVPTVNASPSGPRH